MTVYRKSEERRDKPAFALRKGRPFSQRAAGQAVDRASHDQRRPPCPHYPACYSCPFVRFPYAQQLDKKREIVVQALAPYPALAALTIPPLVPSPHQFGYRVRVKLAVRRSRGKVLIGVYIPETHKVADVSGCAVHPEPINRIVQFLKQAVEQLGILPYDERQDIGQLRYIDARYSLWQRRVLLTLVTRHMDFPQARELTHELTRRFPSLSGIVQNINDKPGNVIWGERFRPLWGRDSLLERIGHLHLRIPVNAFEQANPPVARRLYERVLEWAGLNGEEIALDLYCGIGPIALYLTSKAKLVVGIDDNESAINVAKENARRNGYHNSRFFAGDAAEKLKEMGATLARIDLVVVNPPRKGLSPEAFAALATVKAPKLLYVSCDPLTLARDLDRFSQERYVTHRVQSFDMIPQTDQVETVALLERQQEIPTVGEIGRRALGVKS
ncbi:MAG: 23S rRNA (uracil(1939)-C(5))-methyltransferase RlmD [Candidatus Binatia bacterium]